MSKTPQESDTASARDAAGKVDVWILVAAENQTETVGMIIENQYAPRPDESFARSI